MQLIGFALILLVIALVVIYFFWSKREAKTIQTKEGQTVTVIVKGSYSPNIIKAKINEPLTIIFVRQEDSDCSKRVIIPDFKISEELPEFGQKEVKITARKAGEYPFSCEMGMYQGKIIVE